MGKVNAAHAAAVLIERFSPAAIILFGIGGAYPSSGLCIGDIAVAEKEVYGDEGVLTKEGFRTTDFIGIPLVKKGGRRLYNEFRLDKRLAGLACKSSGLGSKRSPRVPAVCSGTFLTLSTCTGTRRRALELEKRFGAICENMEGAAVAQVCSCYGVPFAEVRGISNIVEDRDLKRWDIPLAAGNAQRAVVELLRRL
jgi:futalosine hydrolase